MLESHLWLLIDFKTRLWPLIALKPSSASIQGPGFSDQDMCKRGTTSEEEEGGAN